MSIEAVDFRPYKESDIPFIQNSWGSSYYKGADYTKFMSPKEFNAQHRPIREQILFKPNVAVIIACSKDDEDLILGWVVVEKPLKVKGLILHYLYVKEAFKGEGISVELLKKSLPESPVMITHMTDRARKIIRKKKELTTILDDFFYAPDTIMVRDKYLNALPKMENYEPKGEM